MSYTLTSSTRSQVDGIVFTREVQRIGTHIGRINTSFSATAATVASADIVLIGDADDSNNLKKTTVADIVALAPAGVSLGLVLALS